MSEKFIQTLKKIKHNPYSQAGNKYSKVFKYSCIESLVNRYNFAQLMHKKWSQEKNMDLNKPTTNDKLNQIINKDKQAIKYKKFLYNTFNQESLLTSILIKKSKEIMEKNKIRQEENKKRGKNENIQKIINGRNKYKINDLFLTRIREENNRHPPICLYTPKYDVISKHISSVNIEKQSKKNLEIDLNEIHKNKKYNYSFSLSPIYKNEKNNQSILSPISSEKSKINLSIIKNNNLNKSRNYKNLLDESENKNQNSTIEKNQFFLSQQNNNESNNKNNNKINKKFFKLLPLSPKVIEKKIPAPNFAKMLSRNKTVKTHKHKRLLNDSYSPNYNAIFLDVVDYKPVDYELKKKKYNLIKILGDFNPTKDYKLFPVLNNNNDNDSINEYK